MASERPDVVTSPDGLLALVGFDSLISVTHERPKQARRYHGCYVWVVVAVGVAWYPLTTRQRQGVCSSLAAVGESVGLSCGDMVLC